MTPTMLNLFFVQEMLKPANPRAWKMFLHRSTRRARQAADPEKVKAQERVWNQKDPARRAASTKAWSARNAEEKSAGEKRWRQENPAHVREYHRKYQSCRLRNDPEYQLKRNLRCRVSHALRGRVKSARTLELLGMDTNEYRIYLQGQFLPGMTWENYGLVWQVDHIRPCASFDLSDPAKQRECFNWSNTQPLFSEVNHKKGGTCSA